MSNPKDVFKRYEPIETHLCSEEELGLVDGDQTKPHLFPPAHGEFGARMIQGAICVDEADLYLYGANN